MAAFLIIGVKNSFGCFVFLWKLWYTTIEQFGIYKILNTNDTFIQQECIELIKSDR